MSDVTQIWLALIFYSNVLTLALGGACGFAWGRLYEKDGKP